MLGLGLALSLGSSRAFTPLSLSPAAWYDPSDLSTMFQDTAGTTPVTTDGDPVGRINDKSGNGRNLLQATAASRPLYKTSGGLHWLLFDGSDDFLETAAFALTDASGHHSSGVAMQLDVAAGVHSILDADDGSANRLSQFVRVSGGTPESIAFNTGAAVFSDNCASVSTNDAVLTQQTASSAVEIFKDGAGDGSTAITGSMKTMTRPLCVGANNSGAAQFLDGRVYGAVHLARALAPGEMADLVTYLGKKQGRTI